MAPLTEEMKETFVKHGKQGTYVVASASKDGVPNAVPIGAVKLLDDETILLSDQFFKKTLANLNENPVVAISFWDGFKGYQIKGKAEVTNQGKIFDETAQWVKNIGEKVGVTLRPKNVVVVKIQEIYCVTPGPEAGKKLS